MRGKVYCCLISALLVATAWAAPHDGHDHGDHSVDHHHHLHHGKDEPHPSHEGNDACHLLAPHNADFAFALYKKLALHPEAQGKNIFFSPVSIAMSLSMLAVGAKGDTHSQIYASLGYSNLQPQQVNEGFEHLLHMLGHSQDAMQLEAGAGVAIRENFKANDKFLKDINHYFSSEAFSVDFSKPDIAAQEINKFIAKKTHDKITDMVKDLDPSLVMMLINYMYFRGKTQYIIPPLNYTCIHTDICRNLVLLADFELQILNLVIVGKWDKPFDVKQTHKANFHVDKDTTVEVDMMKRTGRYDIYQDHNHTTVMMIPYKGNTSMMIILPDEGKIKEVEDSICRHHLKNWHDKLFRRYLYLYFPDLFLYPDNLFTFK